MTHLSSPPPHLPAHQHSQDEHGTRGCGFHQDGCADDDAPAVPPTFTVYRAYENVYVVVETLEIKAATIEEAVQLARGFKEPHEALVNSDEGDHTTLETTDIVAAETRARVLALLCE
jgi:hypothetical protein